MGALLVISENQLVGILSERDYARKVILKGRSSKETQVHETSSFRYFQEYGGRLHGHHDQAPFSPSVVKDSSAVGVVSIGDLVKSIISGQARTIRELKGYITGKYPG